MNALIPPRRSALAARRYRWTLSVFALLLFQFSVGFFPTHVQGQGQWSAGVVFDREGLRSFHLAIGSHYGVPVSSVARYSPAWLHPDELPVVYLVAQEARISPAVVISLREMGWSWIEIVSELRLSPAIFVAGLPRSGPLAARGSYWRPRNSRELWALTDWEIIDFVNLSFWARAHRRPAETIIIVRRNVPTWVHYVYAPPPAVVIVQQPVVYTQIVSAPPRVVVAPSTAAGAGAGVRPQPSQQRTGTVPEPVSTGARPAQPRASTAPVPQPNAPVNASSVGRGSQAPPVAGSRVGPGTNPVPSPVPSPATNSGAGPATAPGVGRGAGPVVGTTPPANARSGPEVGPPAATSSAGRGTSAPPVAQGRGAGGGGQR
jgi:hypothetical protein